MSLKKTPFPPDHQITPSSHLDTTTGRVVVETDMTSTLVVRPCHRNNAGDESKPRRVAITVGTAADPPFGHNSVAPPSKAPRSVSDSITVLLDNLVVLQLLLSVNAAVVFSRRRNSSLAPRSGYAVGGSSEGANGMRVLLSVATAPATIIRPSVQ